MTRGAMTYRDRRVVSLAEIVTTIDALLTRGRTLVVGPWLGEVGYEALYWIPFLQWVIEKWGVPPERVVALSRGGVAGWYSGIAGRYIELWEDIDLQAWITGQASRGMRKQFWRSPFDELLLSLAYRRLGTKDVDVLHPSLMYRARVWKMLPSKAAPLRYRPMRGAHTVIEPDLLPREPYVAMKLYHGDCLPAAVRPQLARLVADVARRWPVVLLDTGFALKDGHHDYTFEGPRVISARRWLRLESNLGAQTQIIAGAKGFIGAAGGITWLVPRLGVDTTALADAGAARAQHHIQVATRAYGAAGGFRVRDFSTARVA